MKQTCRTQPAHIGLRVSNFSNFPSENRRNLHCIGNLGDHTLRKLSYCSCSLCISSTLMKHIISVLMVIPNFWNPLMPLIPFWRAALALVLKCYEHREFLEPTQGVLRKFLSLTLGI
jgi:hypothetical protein